MVSSKKNQLQKIGKIINISKSNLVTIKSNSPVKLGSRILLKNGNCLGIVVDVFGPIHSPYISVKPENIKDIVIGSEVYIMKKRGREDAKT
ncbi:MAG: Gar1/Naf1 family protein [Candidatus Verstraetearchaeota archaeon]|jgi:rRNA processing protein Gar1|nr:Gar1/Naf1 family protein [Candidatus Verstraetearchaeota archaeon]